MSYNALRAGRFSESGREYFVTTVVRNRRPMFTDFYAGRVVVRQLRQMESEGIATWLTWVLMPDHFHGLLVLPEKSSLELVMKRLKGRTARALNRYLGRQGPVWQPGYYDHALRYEEDRRQLARYIVANPLRSGLVSSPGDYPFWDSVWL